MDTLGGWKELSDTPVIRPLTNDDVGAFLKMSKDDDPEFRITKEQFERLVQGDAFFGLFINDFLIGHLNLQPFGDDESHFQGIYILSEHRGKGYGSLFVKHALEWFRYQGTIRKVHLYTEQTNVVAQNLYKKYGFEITSEAWHFIAPLNTLKPLNMFTCEELRVEEIDIVGSKFKDVIPAAYIKRHLASDRHHFFTLKDSKDMIVGACRFDISYSGCFPFIIETIDAFDDFLAYIQPFSLEEFDYIRFTFFGIPKLASLCKSREYKLHHEMVRMTCTL